MHGVDVHATTCASAQYAQETWKHLQYASRMPTSFSFAKEKVECTSNEEALAVREFTFDETFLRSGEMHSI